VIQLSRGLTVFPEDYECLIYRGKLYIKMEDYEKAIENLSEAIRLTPSKGFSYIGKADCLKSFRRLDEAIDALI
jgi:tetratricopeptide (TPR) repeat protein